MRRPVGTLPAAVAALLGWIAVTMLAGPAPGGAATLPEIVSSGIAVQVIASGAFALLVATGLRWSDAGLAWPDWRTLPLLWFPALYIAAMLGAALAIGLPPPATVGIVLANAAFVGISEEVMFRGILLAGLRPRLGLRGAVAGSTLTFGAVHVLNVLLTGDLATAVAQAFAAVMSGTMLAAARLRTGSLLPAVLLHGLWDFAALTLFLAAAARAGAGAPDADALAALPLWARAAPVAFVLPIGLYGAWLLRRLR